MERRKRNVSLFVGFGALMAALHLAQCYFRVKAHQVFLILLSSSEPGASEEQSWIRFSNCGKGIEVAYYIVGALVILFFLHRWHTGKISLRDVLAGMSVIYLVTAGLVLPLVFGQKDVSNLLLPIFISFFFSCLFLLWACWKKHRIHKPSRTEKN